MTERTVSVSLLIAALANEEHQLKKLGAFAQAEGVRTAITRIWKLSDETKSETKSEPKQ